MTQVVVVVGRKRGFMNALAKEENDDDQNQNQNHGQHHHYFK